MNTVNNTSDTTRNSLISEQEEFALHYRMTGLKYLLFAFSAVCLAYISFWATDTITGVLPPFEGIQLFRLVSIALLIGFQVVARLHHSFFIRHYNVIASLSCLMLIQATAYIAYASRVQAGVTDLYWSMSSSLVVITIGLYGCARLPLAITYFLSVITLIMATYYATQLHADTYQPLMRLLIHLGIANIIGYLTKVPYERREQELFFLSKENLRKNIYAAELENYARKLAEQKEKAEAASVAKDRFLSVLSHELRTPMNAVISTLSLLPNELGDKVNTKLAELVASAQTSSKALLAILEDVLEFVRLSTGRATLDANTFDLRAFMQATLSVFEVNAQIKSLELRCKLDGVPENITYIIADQQKLRRILFHLIGNALKFTERGSVTVSAIITDINDDKTAQLTLAVLDTGPGIPQEFRSHLFAPFTQADDSSARKAGGLGLGLAMVKSMVDTLGGNITFLSTDKGTKFSVDLPIRIAPSDEQAEDAEPPRPPTATATALWASGFPPPGVSPRSGHIAKTPAKSQAAQTPQQAQNADAPPAGKPDSKPQLRILLVEDQPINAQVTGFMLEQMGMSYIHALSGEEALHLCKEEVVPFDLILMDYQMPGMDGVDTTKAIREWEVNTLRRATPIIALTANATIQCRKVCLAAGMNGYLTKPVESAVLQQTIYTHVTRARLDDSQQ